MVCWGEVGLVHAVERSTVELGTSQGNLQQQQRLMAVTRKCVLVTMALVTCPASRCLFVAGLKHVL